MLEKCSGLAETMGWELVTGPRRDVKSIVRARVLALVVKEARKVYWLPSRYWGHSSRPFKKGKPGISNRRNENRDTEEIWMTGKEKSLRNNLELCVYEGVGIQVKTLTAPQTGQFQ